MRGHAAIGQRVLERAERGSPDGLPVSFLRIAGEMAGSHHERWDGTGYPGGLAGDSIPLAARLMSLADVYDALRSRRPYKEPMTHDAAAAFIQGGAGTQFDPAVVGAFVAVQAEFVAIARHHADEEAGGPVGEAAGLDDGRR